MNIMDLRDCLASWPYDAERNVRLARGGNGREFILIRQPMGLEQYEVDGRPDGRQVNGMATVLDFQQARLQAARQSQVIAPLELSPEECAELFDEASVFLHRLKVLFRLKDWTRAERDAALILRLLDSVRQHARWGEDRVRLESWRPHLRRLQSLARGLAFLAEQHHREAGQAAREFPVLLVDAGGDAGGDAADPGRIEEGLLEGVRAALAALPAQARGQESTFLRQGEYWNISHQGQTALLKHMRGLQCLACLLRAPGQEFHVSELLVSLMDTPAAALATTTSARVQEEADLSITLGFNQGLPVLDAQAKKDYQRRLHELRQELAEAEQFNDPGRGEQAREELNLIADQLAAAIGLGGRDRTTSSAAERARCAVTKRIKKAIQKISEAIPTLGHHLASGVKTGYFCCYRPDPGQPVAWNF